VFEKSIIIYDSRSVDDYVH